MKIFRNISIGIIIAINIIVAGATIFAAYAGHISPISMKFAPIACMLFPLGIIATLIMIPISFFTKKWFTLIPLATISVCLGPFLSYCPLNFFTENDHKKQNNRDITLLSYNAYNFKALDKVYPSDSTNATLSYIIDTDADIVCLQECEYLSPMKSWHVYRPQINKLKEQYPYRIIGEENGESILSKYPVEEISSEGFYSHFRLKIHNKTLDIIDVHLRSLRLTDEEKKQYSDISDLSGRNSKVKDIARKVAAAAKNRARQAEKLRKYINKLNSENIIVCGDFNDVPGCYAINTMCEGFDDAYADCGVGPTITYHGDKIYFRIDHILYKGNLVATSCTRGDIDRSDHYPLLATFHWKKKR